MVVASTANQESGRTTVPLPPVLFERCLVGMSKRMPPGCICVTSLVVLVRQDWSLKQALDFVTKQRPQVSPNAGFMARLIRLEQSLHGTKTVTVTSPTPALSPHA